MSAPRGGPKTENLRARDLAFIIPAVGGVVLLPPFINIFSPHVLLLGIPAGVVYLFALWGLLILGAYLVTRRLQEPAPDPAPDLAPEVADEGAQ